MNRLSFVAVGLRTLTYLLSMLSLALKIESITRMIVISRGLSILWHFMIVLLCYKFPTRIYKWFALLVMPSYITSFYFAVDIDDSIGSMICAYAFFLVLSILLSTSWCLTSLAMLLLSVTISIVSIMKLHIYTLTFHSMLTSFCGLSIFACYTYEKSEKMLVI